MIPLMVAGAVVGGTMAAFENSAQRKAAEQNIARLGDMVTQNRVDSLRSAEQLSRSAQVEIGNLSNTSPEGLSAMETISSRIVRGVASDQFAIEKEAHRRETAIHDEMKSVADSVQPAWLAITKGAMSGAMMGMNVGGALDSHAATQTMGENVAAADANSLAESNVAVEISEFQRKAAEASLGARQADFAEIFGQMQSAMRSASSMLQFHQFMPIGVRKYMDSPL